MSELFEQLSKLPVVVLAVIAAVAGARSAPSSRRF